MPGSSASTLDVVCAEGRHLTKLGLGATRGRQQIIAVVRQERMTSAMADSDPRNTAQNMIQLHGLRAQAIAMEHLMEMRQAGDTVGLEHWQAVHAAICELRRTGPDMERVSAG
jgi:hypothetical protein